MDELEQLGERIAEQAAHLDAAMHRFLTDLREFDERGGWHRQGARTCAYWLAWRVGWDLVTARERVRVADKLAEFPMIDDALRRGEMSYSKVRAMVRVATPANESLLLDHARLMTASQLEKLCRKYAVVQRHGQDEHPASDEQRRYVRRRDTDDGMVKIEAVLHPEEAELVWAMLDHAATQLAREAERPAGNDVAEPWPAAQASGSAEASPATVMVDISLPSDAAACQSGDSAESWEQPAGPGLAATASPISARDFDARLTTDSAESLPRASAPAATAPGTRPEVLRTHAASSDVAACPTDDSAESLPRASAPAATAPGALRTHAASGDFATCTTDDSAESLPRPSASAATAPGVLRTHAASGGFGTCPSDDSAESLPRASAPGTTAPGVLRTHAASGDFATCTADDPAESLPRASAPAATALGALRTHAASGGFATCPTDDSAESLPRASAPGTTALGSPVALAAPGDFATCPIDDSAESRSPEIPRRSLLDRLLDEADALRIAETGARGEPGASSSTAEAPSNGLTERVPSVLRQRADTARRAFNRADALLAVAQQYLRGDRPDRAPIEIVLTIPESSLRAGAADPLEVGEIGESFVSREAARRLSCDAGVVEVVEDERGTPLSVGRKRRTIAGALKRALRKRDTTCCYPGCTNRMFLEGHHIKHWADGGETSLRNSALLCSFHHRYVHEYGYAIELGSDQRPRFRDPRGRLVAEVPERPEIADLGWPRIRAEHAPLSITADTIACGWDGTPADYGEIVGHLLVADGLPGSRASTPRRA